MCAVRKQTLQSNTGALNKKRKQRTGVGEGATWKGASPRDSPRSPADILASTYLFVMGTRDKRFV